MGKDLDKLLGDFKRQAPKLRQTSAKEAEALKKKLRAELKLAWAREDELRDAIGKAREDGHDGPKPKDYEKNSAFKSAYAAWLKACKAHRAYVDKAKVFADAARKARDPLARQLSAAEKENKKSRPDAKAKKQFQSDTDQVRAALEDLEKSIELTGGLKVEEMFYALRAKETIAKIIAEASKDGKDAGGSSPKMLEESARRKSLNTALKMEKMILDLCKEAEDLSGNPRKALQSLKRARGHLDKLNKLSGSYQDLKTKEKDTIEQAKDKKFMLDTIDKIADAAGSATGRLEEATKTVKAA